MSKFWSPFVKDLVPYVPGEQPKLSKLVKLNTNENPYGPSPKAFLLITMAGSFFVDLANAFVAKSFLALPWFAM